MMQVVYDYDLTELKAETLPAQSSQSRDIGSDYRRFLAEYDVVSRAWKDFGEPRGAQWFGRGVRAQAARLAERTASLVELDAAVNAGARLGRTRSRILGVLLCEEATNSL